MKTGHDDQLIKALAMLRQTGLRERRATEVSSVSTASGDIGELFLADDKGELPMRRIIRGISRVLKGETPQPDLTEMARDYWINRGREAEIKPE